MRLIVIDLKLLDKRGISAEKLRPKLEKTEPRAIVNNKIWAPDNVTGTNADKIAEWKNRMRLRLLAGRENNIKFHKIHHAVDLAWETPFRQVTPTLLSSLLDRDIPQATVEQTLRAWGYDLKSVFEEIPDPKTGKTIKKIAIPAFFQVFVPLVRAYVTIRLAKIMNDRKRQPFFKYEPAINTAKNRLRTEALTQRVEMMNQQYDYWSTVKQSTFQMLHYSNCFAFPVEEWHEECQEVPAKPQEGDPRFRKRDGKWEYVVKEGLRYHMPHPSRTFIDEAHRPSSYNTDTGCEYAGYWRVVRYRDLRNNPKYFNTDKINIGATDWWTSPFTQTFFSTVYNTCSINPPLILKSDSVDRETRMADNYYTQAMDDISVVYTEYFEKLVPSEWGFGDYDYPVWFRFVVAADDTLLYAAPLPYAPVIYWGYDADELRAQNASLSLEVLPFQDHFSNLMTQYLLTVKQNLTNVTLVDEDIVKPDQLHTLKNLGERLYRPLNLFPFSGRAHRIAQHNTPNAFIPFRFPPMDSNGIVQAMKVVLDTLERVLVMSSQEVGQAATHEQTRTEIQHISNQTSTRLAFTATPVDLGMSAMQRQIYYGLMGYGEPEFWSQVPLDKSITKEDLDALGFTYDENEMSVLKTRRLTVKVSKGALMYESFTSSRDGDRINSIEGGTAILNALQPMINGPLFQVIGPDQFLGLINIAAQMLGFPREFRLQNVGEGGNPDQQQQMAQMVEQLRGEVLQDVQKGLKPIMDHVAENEKQLTADQSELRKQLETLLGIIQTDHLRLPPGNGIGGSGTPQLGLVPAGGPG